jgi:ADP-heptose:LPS heptosyltransferase
MAKSYENKVLRNVLITRFSALGDVAMTIPIVYPMCYANPQVNFIFATRKMAEGMFINRPSNLIVLGIDFDKYNGFFGPMKLAGNLQHRYNFDAVADLHDVLRTKFMTHALKRKGVLVATIDKGRKEKQKLIEGNSKLPVVTTHARYKDVFKKLGLKLGEEFISIFEHGEPPRSPIVPAKEEGDRWIAVAPFSQHQGKEYPMEQMQLVIGEMSRWENCHLFLMGGGKKERDVLDPLMRRYSNVLSLPHIKHSFADELVLLSHCDVMLTMDSANMHLASLVDLPVVSVWGATHPSCGFLGWHQALKDTVQLDLECRPCSVYGNKKCRYGDYHCMRDISPEMILKKVKIVLER